MNIDRLNLTLADIESQLLRKLSEMSDGEEDCDCGDPDCAGCDDDEDDMDDEDEDEDEE
jgi:hypothetical protein